MPELPEVETIKLGLQKKIVGLTIKEVEVRSPKSFIQHLFKTPQLDAQVNTPWKKGAGFIGKPDEVKNKKVLKVWRRAKILGIDVEEGMTLLFHLKMTGQLVWIKDQSSNVKAQNYPFDKLRASSSKLKSEEKVIGGHPTPDMVGEMPNSHTRVIFEFSDKSRLYFNDQRRFGWVKVIKNNESGIMNNGLFSKLGPEPLEKEFTKAILKSNLLKHKSMPVKVAIMDQSVVAGVGNIYASEACFDAKIDPKTRVKDLSDEQFKKLHSGIVRSLTDGIKHGGSTRANFVDSDGRRGYFLDYAFVYGRDKKPCKVCKTEIQKTILGGRGTYFCLKCQG